MSMETVNFQIFNPSAGDRILDLGCGEGRHSITAYARDQVEAVAVDLSLTDLKTTLSRFEEWRQGSF